MLSKNEARDLLAFKYPNSKVETGVDLGRDWVFRIFLPIGGGEENMNPFMSVNKTTGATKDFSPASYPNLAELSRLFAQEGG